MNIVQLQEQLKNFSQDQLIREMQMPSGSTPQFLVLGEIMRRQKMQQDFSAQQAKGQPQTTVAEEAIAAAGVPQGGIASMAQALAPQTDMAESTGVQAMAYGGPVKKMAEGDKIVRGGKVLTEQEDGTYRDEQGRVVRSVGEDILSGLATLRDIPSRLGGAARDFSGSFADEMNQDLQRTGDEAMRRQMAERIDANALTGRSGFSTGMPTPQQLAMAAAQPNLPPAPLSAFGPGFEYGGRSAPGPAPSREEQAIAARNELLGGLVGRFDQQAMMEPGAGRAGFATGTPRGVRAPEGFVPLDVQAERIAQGEAAMGGRAGVMTAMPEARGVDLQRAPGGRTVTPLEGTNGFQQAWEFLTTPVNPEVSMVPELPSEPAPSRAERSDRTAGRTDRDQQGAAAVPTEKEIEDEKRAAEQPTPPGGGGGVGGAGGIAGAGGMSSYEQELMDMLNRREKAAEQDKWLALAQVGLNMMSSTQPTLLGAIGEAGVKGVEAARSARDQYDKDRLDLLGALEQSRQARAAAAAKAAGGGASGKPINTAMIGNIEDQLVATQEELAMLGPVPEPSWWSGTVDDPNAAERARLEDRARNLELVLRGAYATHGLPYIPSSADSGLDADLSD